MEVAAREATPADNEALLALAASCPMEGDLGLCVNRAPDFFALNRLEGQYWRVGVVDGPDGAPVGCIAYSERVACVHGRPTLTGYASDLKVHPAHRGRVVADALIRFARDIGRARIGPRGMVLSTILLGNRSAERRISAPRGLPRVLPFATVRARSVPLLWRRRLPRGAGLTVSRADERDLEEMAALWQRVSAGRQFAPAHDAGSLRRWIDDAPALDLSSFWLARDRQGRLAGFFGLWDQDGFKQLRVTGYSRRLALVRAGFNLVAPWIDTARLPPEGSPLRCLTAVNVCVPSDRPDVLRALVLTAYDALRGKGYAFFTVALDRKDPLGAALEGLGAQPTDIRACISAPEGTYDGPPLDDRPVHFEVALV
ncbi:MAG TPA: GNAT family N-acetyltransferase [Myxococcales bacterium]|nr:GNAT family N-acetyltransferase [Myxococcales bacterium]